MARRYYSSTAARTTLTSSITSSGTSIAIAAATNLPSSYPYTMIIDQDTASEEVVEVTARTTLTLTVTRGVDGTSGVSHASGATINHGVSARDFDEPNSHVNTSVLHVTVCTSSTRPGSPSAGQVIFETDTAGYFGWSGSAWAAIGSSTNSFVTYEYTATAGQTTFSGSDNNSATLAYTVGLIQVFLNGVLLQPGDDYTASTGTSVVLSTGATVNDAVAVIAFVKFDVANTYTQSQVDGYLALKSNLAGPTFTGTVTIPTESVTTSTIGTLTVSTKLIAEEQMQIALSDETTAITTGTSKVTMRAPFALTLTQIPRASVNTASSSGLPTVDIKVGGTTILGANKLSIDASEKTSTTAATATTLATSNIADDAEITFDITVAGTGAKGLKVTLYFKRQ